MIEGRPSQTAAFVAAWRALGGYLPPGVRLSCDPWGWSFSPPVLSSLRDIADRFPVATGRILLATPLRRLVLWMQLRTRAIDDITRQFVRDGGGQIVILGAGFDSRSVRLASELDGARVFEVDHPATQTRKRAVIEADHVPSNTGYVSWDFERDPLERLPAKLRDQGLNPDRGTLTIWEGVIPYLTEHAIEATLSAVRAFGSKAESRVILQYIAQERIQSRHFLQFLAARLGEPMRFGWDPGALDGWLSQRGFKLLTDRTDDELSRELFANGWAGLFHGAGGHIAVAKPTDGWWPP